MQNCRLQSAHVLPFLPLLTSLPLVLSRLPVRGIIVLLLPHVHLQNERGAAIDG